MRSFKSLMLLLAAAAGFSSVPAQAQHVFRPYVGLAWTDYSIKFDSNAFPVYANKTAKSTYLAPNVGISWITPQRIFVDFTVQRSGSATHDLWNDALLGGSPAGEQDFSYNAEALTVGYVHLLSQGQTISGFGGLRHGKTTLNAPRGATVPGFAGTITWSKDVFDSKGIFFGAAWGLPAWGGSINLSGALAILGGNWKDDDNPQFNADANATVGLGLNASYTYRFAQAWGVTADIRLQSYGYNFTRPTTTGSIDYNVNERIASLGARVSYQF